MVDKTISHFSTIATSQVDPNAKQQINWSNVANSVGDVDTTHATSYYSMKKVATKYKTVTTYDKNGKKIEKKEPTDYAFIQNKPWTLAYHNFNFNIPSNAKIKKIVFTARIKIESSDKTSLKVKAPICDFRVNNSKSKVVLDDDTKKSKTGWYKNHYLFVPQKTYLNTSYYDQIHYVMDWDTINEAKITPNNINNEIMGADLIWQDAEEYLANANDIQLDKLIKHHVYISWVKCSVTYDIPDYKIDIINAIEYAQRIGKVNRGNIIDVEGSEESPFVCKPNQWYDMVVTCTNDSTAKGSGTRQIRFDNLPWGVELRREPSDYMEGEAFYKDIDGIWKWVVPVASNTSFKANFHIKSNVTTTSRILANLYKDNSNEILDTTDYWIRSTSTPKDVVFDNITLIPVNVNSYSLSCVDIVVHGVTNTTVIPLTVATDIPVELPIEAERDGKFFSLESFESEGNVEILSQSGNTVNLQVENNVEFSATLKYCFYPLGVGNMVMNVSDGQKSSSAVIVIEQTPPTVLDFQGGDIVSMRNHRIYTEVDSDVAIIDAVSDELDASMVMGQCQIHLNVWEDLDYIGCVPLEHLHFDPKSTYKDTLINSSYKNKHYMGKKLATDEDITLNVRLHPQQVTTIQGLIDMDKPIPINANHRCFEGDALNHRGWCEIYSIKSEKTNEHWYKCDIDVKYLTHNLKTRFIIERGQAVNDYNIPSVLSEVVSSGDNLSNTTEESYFVVDTDGTFAYNEDYDDVEVDNDERNVFQIDNGEYIHIQSLNPVSHNCQIAFNWSSVLIPEHRENKVSKIVKLVDKDTGNSILEYEYNTLEFIYTEDVSKTVQVLEEIRGTVIIRQEDKAPIEEEITYRFIDEIEDTEEVEGTGLARYGSNLKFNINNNKLEIIDDGFNGAELHIENLDLKDVDYYYAVDWVNNNDDGETDNIECYVDFQVQDTVLSTTYVDKFGKLVISPFPVSNKKLLFTREAEEGTLYYYQYDEREFSYIVEPYYQYMNGCDLVGDGTSIFNLNYGYEIVYIQNGLVRLGFNRIDEKGHMYLAKYDPVSESYVTISRFKIGKYLDLNVNAISDDKIEVQASDSTFTIYRGHPYIKINHNDEDIMIDTLYNMVWAEELDGKNVGVPAYWDLLNTKNLLPQSIGGYNTLNTSEITIREELVDENVTPTLNWTTVETNGQTYQIDADIPFYDNTDIKFNFTGSQLQNYSDEIFIDGGECSFGTYEFEKVSDNVPVYVDVVATKNLLQTGETTRLNSTVKDWSYNGVEGITVKFYEVFTPSFNFTSDKDAIEEGEVAHLSAKLVDEDDGSGISDMTVNFIAYNPHLFYYDGRSGVAETDSWTVQTGASIIKNNNGTYFSASGMTGFIWANLTGTPSEFGKGDYFGDFTVEFDVISSSDANNRLLIYEEYFTGATFQGFNVKVGHNKLVKEGNTFKFYVDDVQQGQTVTKNLIEPLRIGLAINDGKNMTFKNFNIGGF